MQKDIPTIGDVYIIIQCGKSIDVMLLAYTAELPDNWQVTLADWKREHGYHSLTDARANSFVKFMQLNCK